MTTARGDERGSLTVELVVLTPVLLIMALAMLAFGRVAEARQQVVGAARAGAEAASVAPDVARAEAAAATGGDGSLSRSCVEPVVITDVGQFHPGGFVTVTVVCRVPLADVAIPGMPGSTVVTASSTAPIDPYRSVG